MISLLTLTVISSFSEVALKSVVILGAAWVITLALRKSSAGFRHLIWILAVVGVLILPLAQKLTPHPPALSVPVSTISRLPALPSSTHVRNSPLPAISSIRHGHVNIPEADKLVSRGPNWMSLLTDLWLLGVICVMARLVAGVMATRRIVRKAEPILDADLSREVEAIRRQLGIRRNVEVRQSSNLPVPVMAGIMHQVLLLPMSIDDWTPECRHSVLVHELAHVRRWDTVTQMLASLACALYWANPLIWIAAARLRVERELACDDIVLSTGSRASDYAGHLLHIAATMPRPFCACATLPMARTSKVEGRLRSILAVGIQRNAVSPNKAIGAFAMSLISIVVLAATSCSRNIESSAIERAGTIIVAKGTHAQTVRGTKVELLGVTTPFTDLGKIDKSRNYFGYPRKWWSSDGRPIDLSKLEKEYRIEPAMLGSSGPAREVLYRVIRPSAMPVDITMRFTDLRVSAIGTHSSEVASGSELTTQAVRISFSTDKNTGKQVQRFTVRLGIADGPWEKVYDHRQMEYGHVSVSNEKGLNQLMGPTATSDGGIRFLIDHKTDALGFACRLIAIDKAGNIHLAKQGFGSGYGRDGGMMTDFLFDHLPIGKVKYFEFQTRPYTWVEFKNIAFSPKK